MRRLSCGVGGLTLTADDRVASLLRRQSFGVTHVASLFSLSASRGAESGASLNAWRTKRDPDINKVAESEKRMSEYTN